MTSYVQVTHPECLADGTVVVVLDGAALAAHGAEERPVQLHQVLRAGTPVKLVDVLGTKSIENLKFNEVLIF